MTLTHMVRPDEALSLNGTAYRLRSVICHMGDTPRCGHYIAFARDMERWWLCDDSTRRLAPDSEITSWSRRGCADKVYIVCYDRV